MPSLDSPARLVLLANSLMDFLPFIIVFVIFWLLVFRPSSKERKQREEQIKNIKKYDRVITNAGIHGVVVGLEQDAVMLRVDDKNNVRIKFARAAIWQVNPEGAGAPVPEPADEAAGSIPR